MEDVLLDFSQLLVWKRAVCFLPREIVMLCGKKLSSSEIPEFHKGGPLQTGLEASPTNEK